ncbi:MAG: hypothetical protein JXR83_20280 [Deltaproteobacteria bacterium]|nr:hypothetical protein [Deltaproteobacteria bacterium]
MPTRSIHRSSSVPATGSATRLDGSESKPAGEPAAAATAEEADGGAPASITRDEAAALPREASRASLGGPGVLRYRVEEQLGSKPDKPHRAAPETGVQQLYQTYGVERRLGRPAERLLKWASVVQEACVAKPTASETVDHLVAADTRRKIFLLEGLLKLYKGHYGKKIEKHFVAVKQLEDVLGAFVDAQKIAKLARDKGLPDAAARLLEQRAADLRNELVAIVEERWMPKPAGSSNLPAVAELVGDFEKIHWDKYKDDREFVQDEINDKLKKVEAFEYDMHELQGDTGLHELRRQLRWIPVYAEALDGLVVLTEDRNPIPSYRRLLQDPLATSKYVQLPAPDRESDPILFSRSLYTANMKMVLDFGRIKDTEESVELFAQALLSGGVVATHEAAEKQAIAALGYEPDVHAASLAEARESYRSLQELEHFRAVRREFKEKDR